MFADDLRKSILQAKYWIFQKIFSSIILYILSRSKKNFTKKINAARQFLTLTEIYFFQRLCRCRRLPNKKELLRGLRNCLKKLNFNKEDSMNLKISWDSFAIYKQEEREIRFKFKDLCRQIFSNENLSSNQKFKNVNDPNFPMTVTLLIILQIKCKNNIDDKALKSPTSPLSFILVLLTKHLYLPGS